MKTVRFFFFLFLFFSAGFTSFAQSGVPVSPQVNSINSADTVVFDLSHVTCSGSFALVPVYILSDDNVWALDFSFRFNLNKMTYHSLVNYTSYLSAAENFNSLDSLLRFSSNSFQQIDNNTVLVAIKFQLTSGRINSSDFSSMHVYLNGDPCSVKVIEALPGANVTTSGPAVLATGDSVSLIACSGPGFSYTWLPTGETTQTIVVADSGLYTVIVNDGNGCLSDFQLRVFRAVPLPVELITFEVNEAGESIQIDWSTSTELNNDFFTIERSNDMTSWNEVSRVKGAGTSAEINNYHLTDLHPFEGINYYRLIQTDFDGSGKWIGTGSAVYSGTRRTMSVFPNPAASRQIRIRVGEKNENTTVHIRIYSSMGLEILSKTVVCSGLFSNGIHLPEDLTPGIYLIILELGNETYSQQLILQ